MNDCNKIHVLNEIKSYFRIITAFNRENFNNHDWRAIFHNSWFALCACVILICTPMNAILYTWNLAENGAELKYLVAALPIMICGLYLEIAFTSLLFKNHRICGMIEQLEVLINQRRFIWLQRCSLANLGSGLFFIDSIRRWWINAVTWYLQGRGKQFYNRHQKNIQHFMDDSYRGFHDIGNVSNIICYFWSSSAREMDFALWSSVSSFTWIHGLNHMDLVY